MVGSIDIHTLTFEELSGVVDLYPWYAGARMELCRRMRENDTLGEELLCSTALYVPSRKTLHTLYRTGQDIDCTDKDVRSMTQTVLPHPNVQDRQIYVVGGDYFSQSRYNEVRQADDNFLASVTARMRDDRPGETAGAHVQQDGSEDFCTETLARIYLEQGYAEQAVDIYSKLSLRYPEKSIYFATLIDEIKQKYDNK